MTREPPRGAARNSTMSCEWCFSIPTASIALLFIVYFLGPYLFPRRYVSDLASRFVLITGCDTGFGRATAVKLDQLGLHVFATCLTEQGAASLRSECSHRVKTLMLDVTSSENIHKVYEEVKNELPKDAGLWGLVNNAGIAIFAPVEWMPLTEYKKMADVNLWGLIDVTQTFLPLIRKSKGRVVMLSSIAGRLSIPNTGAYSLTKHGVEAIADALRREIYPWGVGVSMVEPGGFNTRFMADDILQTKLEDIWNGMSEELKAEYGEDSYKARLWGLVNNAGIAIFCPTEWLPLTEYKKMADVNLWGLIDVTQTFLPLIRKSKGRVVMLSSIAGRLSNTPTGPYSLTKYGVEAIGDALRREMYPWGVGVSMVEPGGFHTQFLAGNILEKKLDDIWNGLSEELKAGYGEDSHKTQMAALKGVALVADTDLSQVVNAVEDALLSCSPKPRYLVGKDAKYLYLWLTIIPTEMADWILRMGAKAARMLLEK